MQCNAENPERKRRGAAWRLFYAVGRLLRKATQSMFAGLPLTTKSQKFTAARQARSMGKLPCFSPIHETCVSRNASIVESFMSTAPSLTLVFADWFKSGLWPTRATRPSKPKNLEMDLKFYISRGSRWSVEWILLLVFAWISMVFVTCNLWSVM